MEHETPAWKAVFPVAWSDDQAVTRRAFGKALLGASGACVAATAALTASASSGRVPSAARLVGLASEIAPGAARIFHYPSPADPCLLIRLDAVTFAAFAQRCTHLGCPVYFRPAPRTLHCPCHEGHFDAADGRVLAGPPRRPLPRVRLERRGDELWAVGMEA
jgi:Rieske Fe-S protein